MPTQMPKNGRPSSRTLRVSASTMPGTASSPRRQSANAPTPGSTMRSAAATSRGSDVTAMVSSRPASRGRALERLGGGVQVARAVIDDGDAHRSRSASGKRPITGSPVGRGRKGDAVPRALDRRGAGQPAGRTPWPRPRRDRTHSPRRRSRNPFRASVQRHRRIGFEADQQGQQHGGQNAATGCTSRSDSAPFNATTAISTSRPAIHRR